MARSASTTTNTGNLLANDARWRRTPPTWSGGKAVLKTSPNITARLFVSASNTNNVYVLGATESGDLSRLETINLALTPNQPLGIDAQRSRDQRGWHEALRRLCGCQCGGCCRYFGRAQPGARIRADGLVSNRRFRLAGRAYGRAERKGPADRIANPKGPNPAGGRGA